MGIQKFLNLKLGFSLYQPNFETFTCFADRYQIIIHGFIDHLIIKIFHRADIDGFLSVSDWVCGSGSDIVKIDLFVLSGILVSSEVIDLFFGPVEGWGFARDYVLVGFGEN